MARICSVQSGSASFSTTSVTVTISSIDTAKSFLTYTVRSSTATNNDPPFVYVGGYINSSTQIIFNRRDNEAGTSTLVVDWFVVTFSTGMSVQRGTDSITSTVTNKTITSINTAKSFVHLSTYNTSSSEAMRDYGVRADISSSTNLALDSPYTSAITCYWQVIEYQNCSVQKISKSFTTETSGTSSITSITTSSTFISHTGKQNGTGNNEGDQWHFYLSDSTTLSYARRNGANQAADFITYVVSFLDSSSISRYTSAVAANTSTADVTVSISDTSSAFIIGHDHNNNSCLDIDDYTSGVSTGKRITSSTKVRLERRTGTLPGGNTYWELIEHVTPVTSIRRPKINIIIIS